MKILYICTHNRCRSILSEAITNKLAKGKITAFSAGSQPAGQVHPLSLKYLEEQAYSIQNLQSQSWDEFEDEEFDVVVTVCDSAANEVCPVWFDDVVKLHWGLPDPSKLQGEEDDTKAAFLAVMQTIENRVEQLVQLDLQNLSKQNLQMALSQIT